MANLYTYLIKNGLNTIELTPYIYSQSDNDIKLEYLKSLKRIDLKSTQRYNQDSFEFKNFDMLQSLSNIDQSDSENEDKIHEILNDGIYIDDIPLAKKNISDNVFFEFKSKDESAKDEKYELKLSKILPNYKDQTEALTNVIENFEPSIKPFLQSKVFKARKQPRNQILKEIHEIEEKVLTPYQIFFLLLHKKANPNVKVFKEKLKLSTYFEKFGETEVYRNNVIEFIEILMHYNFSSVSLLFNGISIKNFIYDDNFSLKYEQLPKFVNDWIECDLDKKEEKLNFLYKLGLNNLESNIIKLRKGLIENDKELFEKGKVNLDNDTLLINTTVWISEVQKNAKSEIDKEFLKDTYEKIEVAYKNLVSELENYEKKKLIAIKNPWSNAEFQRNRIRNLVIALDKCKDKIQYLQDKLFIPMLFSLNDTGYHFKKPESFNFHLYNKEQWNKFEQDVFNFIIEKDELVIDDVLPLGFSSFINIKNHTVKTEVNSNELFENSKRLDEILPFFQDWPKIEEVTIRIYDEDTLPVSLLYNNEKIKSIDNINEIKEGDVYYTCFKDKHSILTSLKKILDDDDYNSLFTFLNDSNSNIADDESDNNVEFSVEESAALKRLFGNDIPKVFFKDLNLAACVSALVLLNKKGYIVSEAEKNLKDTHQYAQLEPVYMAGSNIALKIMCRSAKTGLLHLRASSWDRLDKNDIKLFVKTGKNDSQFYLFDDKQAVLNISETNYQVFRVDAESLVSNTDAILDGKFEKERIWLILKMKDKEEYKSIFGAIRDVENDPDFDNIKT
ncbi:hypothetical protein [Mesoflavibacter zeaxanthinifaciens]|uniref:hypothetical protein n=1 Tax=Mesoflavibacter zeaxanthinifaciens TaxID=393060 RepID=UPI0003FC3B8D|nr:hypothetical protein [Mesoflavibacter zeaxanthinifaciens]